MPFSDFVRSDQRSKQANESSFAFLDRSGRPEIAKVRTLLTDAVYRFPRSDRDEVVARLMSGNDIHFRSAAFEVLLHEGLFRLGFKLEPHPDPGTGTAKRPDFLVVDSTGVEFYLEAVLAGERDGRSPGAEAMKATALGIADATPHAAFLLDIQSDGNPTSQPPGRDLARKIHAWLDSLDSDALRTRLEAEGPDQMPATTWSHEGWELTIRAIPLAPDRRGRTTRLIGVMGDGVRWVNAWEPLRAAVTKKANRYGNLDKPLVVAVNTDSFQLDKMDEVQALYGQEEWVEVLNHPERSGPQRKQNGAWRGPHGPQNRRASAVWFFNDLTPYTLANRRSTIYVNPWANRPVPSSLERFPTARLENDQLTRAGGLTPREMYSLPEGWPE